MCQICFYECYYQMQLTFVEITAHLLPLTKYFAKGQYAYQYEGLSSITLGNLFFCVYVVNISSNNEKIFSAQKADMQSICYWNLVCNGCGVYKLICFYEYFMYFYIRKTTIKL